MNPVTKDQLEQAIAKVDRAGEWPLLAELERDEPDLSEHILEEITHIHHELFRLHLPPRRQRHISRRIRRLCVVIALCLHMTRQGD